MTWVKAALENGAVLAVIQEDDEKQFSSTLAETLDAYNKVDHLSFSHSVYEGHMSFAALVIVRGRKRGRPDG